MIYVMMILICIAIWSTGYAITVPSHIQRMIAIAEIRENPEDILDSMTKVDQLYLLASSVPFVLIPMFFLMDVPRNTIYGSILVSLALVGILFRNAIVKKSFAIRGLAVIELIVYADTVRNLVVENLL